MSAQGVWSKEKAWAWYDARPWIRGCNFMGSDCANRIDQWQALDFDERLETTDRELALAAETGFNSIRIILEYLVWEEEHDSFLERFDRYLDVCAKHGISAMVVFGNDCMPPKDEHYKPLRLGPQTFDWGYHGGRKHSQHQKHAQMGYHVMDEPAIAQRHYAWVKEIITRHKDDPRIIIWDLYNEPGNSRRGLTTLPHIRKFFEIAREINPSQPLTSGIYQGQRADEQLTELDRFVVENSDLISYHNYGPYADNIEIIKWLKGFGRPILNTEWMGRILHNTVQEMFPLFYLEKIGCYNWGFVAGKYQTYEPWNATWQRYDAGEADDVDFTKWFHDLYRPNLRPYDPKEIKLIQRFCKRADDDFAREQAKKQE